MYISFYSTILGSPTLTGTAIIKVFVEDINDHAPKFDKPRYEASVIENSPTGTHILTAHATDADLGTNAIIKYSLLGDHAERFDIDVDTGKSIFLTTFIIIYLHIYFLIGEIVTIEVLDREDIAEYTFTLMARDSSQTDPKASAVELKVNHYKNI